MFLGFDLGTGSVKALLLDRQGCVVREAAAAYRVNSPYPCWAESDPAAWWRVTLDRAAFERLADAYRRFHLQYKIAEL